MLAATQLGLVPPEVKSQLDEAFKLADATRAAWAPGQRQYRSEDVRRIATSLNRSISRLIDAIGKAAGDPLVQERGNVAEAALEGIRELQRFQRALAIPVEQSRKAATVDLPEFRAAIPAMMDRVARIWQSMGPAHDVFLGWMTGNEAEAIAQGFRDILEVVQGMPGAKKPPGFLCRHRGKIIGGMTVVGLGGVTWLLLRRRRAGQLQAHGHDESLPAELPPPPVGVHVFAPVHGDGAEVSPISEVARHMKSLPAAEDLD
jgi:hypothetical protein